MNNGAKQLLLRIGMIIMWFLCIVFFLYIPYLLREKRSINVLVQPSIIDAEYLVDFEKKTGIKVFLSYFEHGEELLVKLRATNGKGYDLIMPTDPVAQLLIQEKLVKKLDRSQLNFFDQLYPALLGKYFDPNNEYTVPCFWSIYGIGIDKNYFGGKLPQPTWGLLFDKKLAPECVIMAEGAREIIFVAAQYLFGTIDNLNAERVQKISQLLQKQKSWVQMYNDLRVEFLLASKVCPVAMISSADLAKILYQYDNIDFIIPKEGSFALIDSFTIPSGSTKEELVYQFLNYLYQPKVLQKYVNKYKFFPSTKNVKTTGKLKQLSIPTVAMFKKLDFFRNVINEHVLSELLIALKA